MPQAHRAWFEMMKRAYGTNIQEQFHMNRPVQFFSAVTHVHF